MINCNRIESHPYDLLHQRESYLFLQLEYVDNLQDASEASSPPLRDSRSPLRPSNPLPFVATSEIPQSPRTINASHAWPCFLCKLTRPRAIFMHCH